MKCKVCTRKAVRKGYCERHVRAYENVTKNYVVWNKAAELPWREYLSEIAKNPVTGEWARDVAEYLSRTGEEPNVKAS